MASRKLAAGRTRHDTAAIGQALSDDNHVFRQLVVSLGVLLGVSAVIGGIVSLVALGAADVAGVAGGGSGSTAAPERGLYLPPRPTATEGADEPAGPESPEPSADATPTKKAEPRRPRRQITLNASPKQVGSMERINLTGRYRNANGTTVQVQRFEGGWTDFPTSATVRGGSFATYVLTGQSGRNRFRVIDESTGRTSNPVSVNVG